MPRPPVLTLAALLLCAAPVASGDDEDPRRDPAYVAFARKRAAASAAAIAKEGKLAPEDVRVGQTTPAEVRPGVERAFADLARWASPEEGARWAALRSKLVGLEVRYIVNHHAWNAHPTAGIGVTFEVAGAPRLLAGPAAEPRALDLAAYGFEGADAGRDLLAFGERFMDLAAAAPGSVVEGEGGRLSVAPDRTGRGRLPRGTVHDFEVALEWQRPAADGVGVDRSKLWCRRSNVGDTRSGEPGGQARFAFWFSPEENAKHVMIDGGAGGARPRFLLPGSDVKGAADLAAYLGEGEAGAAGAPAPAPAKGPLVLDERRGLPLAWGAPRAEVVALLGPAESEERDAAGGADVLFWRGIAAVLRDGKLAEVEVAFVGAGGPRRSGRHKKFRGKTAGGIGAGSKPEDLDSVYGEKGELGEARHGVVAARWKLREATVAAVFEEDEGLRYLVFAPPGP
jgi:hypothetical protein